jgi:hypothetical protein
MPGVRRREKVFSTSGRSRVDSPGRLLSRTARRHHQDRLTAAAGHRATRLEGGQKMKCPDCNSEKFYVKNPEDEYEVFTFQCPDNVVCFDADVDEAAAPEVGSDTETYCERCAWHGKLSDMKP